MWYLTSQSEDRVLYVLPNKEISIGRRVDNQVCDFAIPDDPSISRKHAILSVTDNCLYVQDLGSRYGTWVQGSVVKLSNGSKVMLHKDEHIKFGKMTSEWIVHKMDLVTCTSTLKGENLQNLKLVLSKLSGSLKNEWDDTCTFLTMPAITLTIKVVLALVQGSHIVTTAYWTQYLDAVSTQSILPDPKDFVPTIVESTLNKDKVSFLPNENRKSLFSGKTILFFSKKQMDMYKAVLIKCAANPILLSESKMTKSSLCSNDVIVIQYNLTNASQENQSQKNQIVDIVNYLKSKGKRLVADAEIGLAILYCSTARYCNPTFNYSSEVIKQQPATNSKTNVLAQESQEPANVGFKKENVIINESLTSKLDLSNSTNSKRKLSIDDDDLQTNATKKLATKITTVTNESGKRKFNEENDSEKNPNKRMAVDEDDEFFNFKAPVDKEDKGNEKKLNFSKPLKRKHDVTAHDEDGLFNFVSDSKISNTDNSSLFETKKVIDIIETVDEHVPPPKVLDEKPIDIASMRGSKLKELDDNKFAWNSNNHHTIIKKEIDDELENKMNSLALGTTIITIRTDLIIKKEPIEVTEQNTTLKNFKKFKKVWPVKSRTFVSTCVTANDKIMLEN